MKSQSGFMSLLTDRRILEGRAPAALVEFQSARISRVVKSTMSAESASLSLALDRQLYLRLLVEAFIWGEPGTTGNWRHNLKLPGIMVTDARSLYDHLCTTGSMPSERQTLIDLLIARDLTEAKAMEIRWVPTTHMLADALTKSMRLSDVMHRFMTQGVYSLVPTEQEEKLEEHRKALRQGQRGRRKEKMKQLSGNSKRLLRLWFSPSRISNALRLWISLSNSVCDLFCVFLCLFHYHISPPALFCIHGSFLCLLMG